MWKERLHPPTLFLFTKLWNICKMFCVKKDLPFSMFLVTWTQFQQWHEHGFWPNNCRLTLHLFIRESSPRTWRKWWTAIWSSLSASTYSVSTLIEKVVWLIRILFTQYILISSFLRLHRNALKTICHVIWESQTHLACVGTRILDCHPSECVQGFKSMLYLSLLFPSVFLFL